MKQNQNRRRFIKTTGLAAAGLGFASSSFGKSLLSIHESGFAGTRIGIIGLDTSHGVSFAKALNSPAADYGGYKIVAAYPYGSKEIKSSFERIAGYIEDVKKVGVEIVGSVEELLNKVDVVMLETNDGRLRPAQALQVIKAGKPFFMDKPAAVSVKDLVTIFNAAKKANVPVFTSSALRFTPGAQEVVNGKIGKVLGADAYSPATLESTHPDLYWYGIHGVETIFTVMGSGCKEVVRLGNEGTDVVVGTWNDGRIATLRGTRTGKHLYGGTAFGENGTALIGDYAGYNPLLLKIIEFFKTGVAPVKPEETLEIYAFMEAADLSKKNNGAPVTLASVLNKTK
jgi:predicted dehydrogenase